jgi:manganese/iron transport system substrate-binding protein
MERQQSSHDETHMSRRRVQIMSMEWKRVRWLEMAFVAALLLVSACGPTTPQAEPDASALAAVELDAGEKLGVVATTNIVADVIGQVGGDHIELTTLMKVGIDPHSYVPRPADTAAIHDAHVVFANGAGLEADLEEVFRSAGGDAVEIQLSEGIELQKARDPGEKASDEHGHEEGVLDPHVWFDVKNVIHWVEMIEQTLSSLDPANASAYRANALEYTQQLDELDAWVADQVATIPEAHRRLVTNHPSFGYLASRYGLEQVGAVYPLSPASEPSAQDIAALQDAIREYGVPAVFTESTVNPKLAQQVAEDTGVRLVALYSGSLGGPGSGAESYIDLIRFDVSAIVNALR